MDASLTTDVCWVSQDFSKGITDTSPQAMPVHCVKTSQEAIAFALGASTVIAEVDVELHCFKATCIALRAGTLTTGRHTSAWHLGKIQLW